jgi:hypothetical protein
VRAVPRLCVFYPGICFRAEEKCMDRVLKLLRTQGTTAKLTIVQKSITVQNICIYLPIQAGKIFKIAVCCQDYTESEIDKCGKVMEHWCVEPDSGRPQYSERSLKQCYFVYHKFHTNMGSNPCLRDKPRLPNTPAVLRKPSDYIILLNQLLNAVMWLQFLPRTSEVPQSNVATVG